MIRDAEEGKLQRINSKNIFDEFTEILPINIKR